ncbi:unnamed protein product [Mytilus edulis]|uniref:Uncharacterized protein n=1 Tax=Mytilus edulis TaxID=6550 RepID=A0A8S3S968_MYTED|nr:unnamed protein product [Mytilus edulis]
MPAGLLGYFRKEKHRSILLSEYSSVDYIFLVLGVPGIIPYHTNALLEMLHHIVETVSRANTKEGVLQLDSIMGESALLPYYKLRLKNRSYRLDEAMYLLQDITVDEKNVIVYCYLIHILIAELSVISREKAIDSRKAQTILKACTKVMEKDVSSALLKRVAHVIQHLCKLVYKEEASILLLIDLFYDLFGNEIFLDLIEISLDDRKRVIGLYKPTKHLDCTFVLDRLYNLL